MPAPSPCRAIRLLRGVTLHDLARQLGIAASSLSMVERGLTPASDHLQGQMAQCLGVPRESLFPETEVPCGKRA